MDIDAKVHAIFHRLQSSVAPSNRGQIDILIIREREQRTPTSPTVLRALVVRGT